MILKKELIEGEWYIGKGRGFHVAVWDGDYFRSYAIKFGALATKETGHWEDGGAFAPMAMINNPRFTNADLVADTKKGVE